MTAYVKGKMENKSRRWVALREAAYSAAIANGDDEATAQAVKDAIGEPALSVNDVEAGIRSTIEYVVPFKGLQ